MNSGLAGKKGFQNRRFWRLFGDFFGGEKVTPPAGGTSLAAAAAKLPRQEVAIKHLISHASRDSFPSRGSLGAAPAGAEYSFSPAAGGEERPSKANGACAELRRRRFRVVFGAGRRSRFTSSAPPPCRCTRRDRPAAGPRSAGPGCKAASRTAPPWGGRSRSRPPSRGRRDASC